MNPGATPIARLADRTPYFGRLGEIAYDEATDRVQCHLCGGWYRWIGGTHLTRTHGWSLDEYRDVFRLPRLAPTFAPSLSATMRHSPKRRVGRTGFGVGGPSRKGARQDRIRPWQSLAVRAPELIAELHPTRNPDVDPATLAWAANRRVWWRCSECGHDWRALVSSRTAGSGCPQCARRRGSAAIAETKRHAPRDQSLATLREDLLAIWDEKLNAGLDPAAVAMHSSQRVWWPLLSLRTAMAGNGKQSKPRQRPPLPDLGPPRKGTSNAIICSVGTSPRVSSASAARLNTRF
jgi:hypothetical protein